MTKTIRDIETLKSIQPNQVIAYLQRAGWQKETSIQDKAEIWILKAKDSDQECADILLPLNTSFQDYPIRMSEILMTLEAIEDLPQQEIFKKITHQPIKDSGSHRPKKGQRKPYRAIVMIPRERNSGFYAKNLDW